MMDVFFKTDPSSVYTKVSECSNLSEILQEISVESLEEESSFLAKENESDHSAVGVAINGLRPSVLPPKHMNSILNKVTAKAERSLLELWSYVSMMPPNSEKVFEGEKQVFEVRYLVVDPAQRNRGIATALVKASIKEAAAKGHKFVRIDCTSHFTARIAAAAGLKCIYELNYLDYKNFSGEKIFEKVDLPHTKILVFAGKSS